MGCSDGVAEGIADDGAEGGAEGGGGPGWRDGHRQGLHRGRRSPAPPSGAAPASAPSSPLAAAAAPPRPRPPPWPRALLASSQTQPPALLLALGREHIHAPRARRALSSSRSLLMLLKSLQPLLQRAVLGDRRARVGRAGAEEACTELGRPQLLAQRSALIACGRSALLASTSPACRRGWRVGVPPSKARASSKR